MGFLFYFAFLILIFTAQVSLLNIFAVSGVVPDLSLIFAFYCGAHFGVNRGVLMAGVAGFAQDCLSGGLLGVNTLSKSLIAFFVASIKKKILVENFVSIAVFLALASLVDGAVFYFVSFMSMKEVINKGFFLNSFPVYVIYNALVGPFIFSILNLYQQRNGNDTGFQLPKTL